MIEPLLRRLRLERLFERWLGARPGDFRARIYEALWVGGLLGYLLGFATGSLVTGLLVAG